MNHHQKDWKAVCHGLEHLTNLIAVGCLLKLVDPVSLENSSSEDRKEKRQCDHVHALRFEHNTIAK